MIDRRFRLGTGFRRTGAIAVACAAGVLTAGCSGEVDLPERLDRTSNPVAQVSPTVDPDHVPILAAYEAYLAAYDEASRLGDPDHPGLREHTEGPAYESARSFIEGYASTGWLYTGARVVVWAHVTGVGQGAATPGALELGDPPEGVPVSPLATVSACLDVSAYLPVDADDGSPIATQRDVQEHRATAVLRFDESQDRWLVGDASLDWETPC